MVESRSDLPNPRQEVVASWLGAASRNYLHNEGWITVNRRFHGITMAARDYANENLANNPDAQAAFFDGLTLGLAALAREEDIAHLNALYAANPQLDNSQA